MNTAHPDFVLLSRIALANIPVLKSDTKDRRTMRMRAVDISFPKISIQAANSQVNAGPIVT